MACSLFSHSSSPAHLGWTLAHSSTVILLPISYAAPSEIDHRYARFPAANEQALVITTSKRRQRCHKQPEWHARPPMGGCATIKRLHGGELTNALAPQTWWPATQLLPRLLKAWACHPARRSYGRWCSSSNIGRTDPWSAVVHFLPARWLSPC
jgi:hypothetical protein